MRPAGSAAWTRIKPDPKFVLKQTMPGETFMQSLKDAIKKNPADIDILAKAAEVFGLTDLSQEEKESILANWNEPLPTGDKHDPYANVSPVTEVILSFVAARAGYCFHSYDHTNADVPVYASGAGSDAFAGTYDNTGIYDRLKLLMIEK
jgi:alkaline phosphatase